MILRFIENWCWRIIIISYSGARSSIAHNTSLPFSLFGSSCFRPFHRFSSFRLDDTKSEVSSRLSSLSSLSSVNLGWRKKSLFKFQISSANIFNRFLKLHISEFAERRFLRFHSLQPCYKWLKYSTASSLCALCIHSIYKPPSSCVLAAVILDFHPSAFNLNINSNILQKFCSHETSAKCEG